tara:strand:- start:519 stop:926 length:408 start_codon:yes stop_codon:yes gene_type:complete
MNYEFLEHTGDVKFRASGKTLEKMFISAAEALKESISGNIKILSKEEISFEVKGRSNEELLYNFLEEFLFLLDSDGFLMSKIKFIEISKELVSCIVLGDNVVNYDFVNEVKAITYNEMFVREKKEGFVCEVVLDV